MTKVILLVHSGVFAPYFFATILFESESKLKGSFHFCLNFLRALGES